MCTNTRVAISRLTAWPFGLRNFRVHIQHTFELRKTSAREFLNEETREEPKNRPYIRFKMDIIWIYGDAADVVQVSADYLPGVYTCTNLGS